MSNLKTAAVTHLRVEDGAVMRLEAFDPDRACWKCETISHALRYCVALCVADGRGRFEDVSSARREGTPHLHAKCARCGFERLMECADAERRP